MNSDPHCSAELSGLPWDGPKSAGVDLNKDWPKLKPTTPFGQLPLLEVDGLSIAQCGERTPSCRPAHASRPGSDPRRYAQWPS